MRHYQLGAAGHRGSQAVERLIELAPASGALALWMQHRDVDAIDVKSLGHGSKARAMNDTVARNRRASGTTTNGHDAPVHKTTATASTRGTLLYFDGPIANDGERIFYGPAFERLTLPRQMGLLAHQILHVALRHAPRQQALAGVQGHVDAELFNVCADAIVNSALAHIDWIELPPRAIHLDTLLQRVLGIHEPLPASLQRWDTETLYRAIDDRQRNRSGSEGRHGRDEHASDGDGPGRQSAFKSGHSSRDDRSTQIDTSADSASDKQGAGPDTADHPLSASQRHNGSPQDGPLAELARGMLDPEQRDLLPASESDDRQSAEDSRRWSDRLARVQASDGDQSLLRELLADR